MNLEKVPYAPPPNMQTPHGTDNKESGRSQPAYAQQSGFVPYGYPSTQTSPQDQYVPNSATDTDLMVKGFQFSAESIRRGFIRKVYSILSVRKSRNILIEQ